MDAPATAPKKDSSNTNPLTALPDVACSLYTKNPQDIFDLPSMMFPEPMQLAVSITVANIAWEVFKEVFSIAAGQGAKLDNSSHHLAQIQKEIKDLHHKCDILLNLDFEAAGHRLEHAMNYMENTKTHPDAYEELKLVLDLATKAFYKFEKFCDKVFIQRVVVFSRLMTECYDKETKQFICLPSLSKEDKKAIANGVLIGVNAVLDEFIKIPIPSWEAKVYRWSIKNENQVLLDSLLKVSFRALSRFFSTWKHESRMYFVEPQFYCVIGSTIISRNINVFFLS